MLNESNSELVEEDDDIYTIDEFLACVRSGMFIDYDGNGTLSDGKRVGEFWGDFDIRPSNAVRVIDNNPWATHVVWYNK